MPGIWGIITIILLPGRVQLKNICNLPEVAIISHGTIKLLPGMNVILPCLNILINLHR